MQGLFISVTEYPIDFTGKSDIIESTTTIGGELREPFAYETRY